MDVAKIEAQRAADTAIAKIEAEQTARHLRAAALGDAFAISKLRSIEERVKVLRDTRPK